MFVRPVREHAFVMFRPPDRYSYSYLLGLYLGDGYVGVGRGRSCQLMITCDSRYPELIEDCWAAMQLVAPGCHIGRYQTPFQCIRVVGGSRLWPDAFPQHGPGRKHERPIVLEPWQREIVDAFPREFLRGLIHSDGCRTVNRFSTTLPSGREHLGLAPRQRRGPRRVQRSEALSAFSKAA